MVGFESSANQRLLPPTFPRYTEIRDREASFSYVGDLINSLLHATQVVSHSHSFKQTLDFSHSFNLTSPCALTRSIMQCLYTPLNSSNSSSLASGLPIEKALLFSVFFIHGKKFNFREGQTSLFRMVDPYKSLIHSTLKGSRQEKHV